MKVKSKMSPAEPLATPPSVMWAQRSGHIILTFNAECLKPDIKIENNSISFRGNCAPDQKLNVVDIPLYAAVDPQLSTINNKGRYIEVILVKQKKDGVFWPALTSDKAKHHWLKIDFNKWQDEDDSDDEFENMNDSMFTDKIGNFGDEKEDESSEEEEGQEDLPPLE